MKQNSMLFDEERVELFLTFNSSENQSYGFNPKVKLYVEQGGKFTYNGETDSVHYNNKAEFSKSFLLDYTFESAQRLKFEIVDVTDSYQERHIGTVATTLGHIVGSRNQIGINGINVTNGQMTAGQLKIRFEKVATNNNVVTFSLGADLSSLANGWLQYFLGFFSKTNPILKLYRTTDDDDDYSLVYVSNVVDNNLNPTWGKFDIKISKLCNSDYYRPIKARIFSRKSYEDVLLGETAFTLNDFVNERITLFPLADPQTNHKIGHLHLNNYQISERFEFLDYLKGGTQLNVIVGVDFTASNGDPGFLDSLHRVNFDGALNEYQKAIKSVCSILLDYDYDKRVLMYGFGGKPQYPNFMSNVVQHCFPMNGDPMNPWIFGLDGILNTYSYALQNVTLSGPTLFAPMLHEAMKVAQKNKEEGSVEYTILLILTDGEIHDMEATINCLIQSAQLPLSVIIVGVGSADFDNMKILDGDEGLQNSQGVEAERDLVQFVPFKDFQMNSEELAKHVLEEIPTQLVEYMASVGIKPNPPMNLNSSSIQNLDQNQVFGPLTQSITFSHPNIYPQLSAEIRTNFPTHQDYEYAPPTN